MASETTHDTETAPVANDTDPTGAATSEGAAGADSDPAGAETTGAETTGAAPAAAVPAGPGTGSGSGGSSGSGAGSGSGGSSGSGGGSGSGSGGVAAASGDLSGDADRGATTPGGAAAGAGAVVGAGLGLASLTGTSLTDMLRSREELVGQIEAATGMPGDSIDAFYGAPWNVAAGVNGVIALIAVVITAVLLLGPAKRPGTSPWVRPVALGGLVLGVLGLFVSGGMYLDLFASQPVLPAMPMMPGMPG
ncbi:hypothetical protein [Pseudonocardia sp. NPDC049635]|uniref:hypothetical protein n=1 Tax=Pseudonocardia sp. NPDC049635 TaxID=3155506 RepID=UPI0033DBF8E7